MKIHTPRASAVTMTEIVLPSHANVLGTIFGGTLMAWIDVAAAISAGKHARKTVVTASVDALNFLAPIRVGNVVEIQASVNAVWRTSMEVGVRVESENPLSGQRFHNVTAYLTFVALDSKGKPSPVSDLVKETKDEIRREAEALQRRKARISLAKNIQKSRRL